MARGLSHSQHNVQFSRNIVTAMLRSAGLKPYYLFLGKTHFRSVVTVKQWRILMCYLYVGTIHLFIFYYLRRAPAGSCVFKCFFFATFQTIAITDKYALYTFASYNVLVHFNFIVQHKRLSCQQLQGELYRQL